MKVNLVTITATSILPVQSNVLTLQTSVSLTKTFLAAKSL